MRTPRKVIRCFTGHVTESDPARDFIHLQSLRQLAHLWEHEDDMVGVTTLTSDMPKAMVEEQIRHTSVWSTSFAIWLPREVTVLLCEKNGAESENEERGATFLEIAKHLESTPDLYYLNMIRGWEELCSVDRDVLERMAEEPLEVNELIQYASEFETAVELVDEQMLGMKKDIRRGSAIAKLKELRKILVSSWQDTDRILETIERLDPKMNRPRGIAQKILCLTLEIFRRATTERALAIASGFEMSPAIQ